MSLRRLSSLWDCEKSASFNMTPIIDIVFLLIIFFLVVCQFIEAENFPVDVPDGCEFAQMPPQQRTQVTTVTVMKRSDGKTAFAVGSEKILASGYNEIADKFARLIDEQLEKLPAEGRVVTLRIDKDICFAQAQYALAAVAQSCAKEVQLAVLSDNHPGL